MKPFDLLKGIDKVADIADDNILSQQEKENILTKRMEIDMTSDNQFAKMIRPIVTLLACSLWLFVHVVAVFKEVPSEVLYSSDAAFMTTIGFYFDARRREKITQRKVFADIKIEKEKVKQQRVLNRREARIERMKERGKT